MFIPLLIVAVSWDWSQSAEGAYIHDNLALDVIYDGEYS